MSASWGRSVQFSPLVMCSRWSSVIACRGSDAPCQAPIAAGASTSSRPSRTRIPASVEVTLLAIEKPGIVTGRPSAGLGL
jgi:hypothetical protein